MWDTVSKEGAVKTCIRIPKKKRGKLSEERKDKMKIGIKLTLPVKKE